MKYLNCKTLCLSKHNHDSRFEADYCNRLLAMQIKGEIYQYGVQVPFDLIVNKILICRHNVDFLVVLTKAVVDGGAIQVHETKGIRTAAWSIKRKLFQALNPGIKYVIIQKKLWLTSKRITKWPTTKIKKELKVLK